MSGNLTAGADPRLDKKLDHVLQEFILAKRANNEVRQTFKEEGMTDFDVFVHNGLDDIKSWKRKQNNATKSLSNLRVNMIYNTILYYRFLRSHDIILAEDPENWNIDDFELWIDHGRHPTDTTWRQARQTDTAPTTTTASEIVSNEEEIHSSTVSVTITAPYIESNGEIVSKDVAADDDIDNAKSPKIGDLDGIQDEYYQDDSSSNSTEDVAAAVMKEDEDSRDELDLYQEEIDWLNSTFTTISSENILELIADAVDSYDDIILYYEFLRSDQGTIVLAKDPESWVKDDFDYWIDNDCHPTVASTNAASSGTTANATWRHMLNMMLTMRNHDSNTEAYTEYISNEEDNSNLNDNIPNDGEILSLPLFSSRVAAADDDGVKSDKVKNNVPFRDSPKAIFDFPTHANSSPGFWDDADDDGINNPIFYSSMETPTAASEVVSDEELDSRANEEFHSSTVAVPTTTAASEVVSDEELDSSANVVTKYNANSNLNGVATAIAVNVDDIDNAKSPKIGDLDGINDEYYQANGKYSKLTMRS